MKNRIRIGMRAVASSGSGLRGVDVLSEAASREDIQARAVECYKQFFESDAIVRVSISGDLLDTDYLIATIEGDVRVTSVSRPSLSETELTSELRHLESSLKKEIVPLNATECEKASELAAKQKAVAEEAKEEVFEQLQKVHRAGIELPDPVKSALEIYLRQWALALELSSTIPQKRYTVVDAATGVPVNASA